MKPCVDHWVRSRKTFPWPAKRKENPPNMEHRQRIKTCTKRPKSHEITLFLPKTRGIDARRGISQRAKITTPSREADRATPILAGGSWIMETFPRNSSSFPSQRLCWIFIYCILYSLTPSCEIPHLKWHLSGAHKQCAHYSVFLFETQHYGVIRSRYVFRLCNKLQWVQSPVCSEGRYDSERGRRLFMLSQLSHNSLSRVRPDSGKKRKSH